MFRRLQTFTVAGFFLAFLLLPICTFAWGNNANKLIVNRAIDTLPGDLRAFFENGRAELLNHVNDPFVTVEKTPAERKNQFIFLDKYGRFPFELLPRSYKAAVSKFGRSKLESNGLLPWQIGVYSAKLTDALHNGKWDDARIYAAVLASYVAAAHDPFNTTDNMDGHLSGQKGVNERFGTSLVDRYSSFFFMRPNDAVFIPDRSLPQLAQLVGNNSLRRSRRATRPQLLHRRILRPLL
jgi:hypothetical protein